MRELLALPAWDTPPTPLDAWTARLAELGHPAKLRRAEGETWLVVLPLHLRGYVVLEGADVGAINFELGAPDPAEAVALLEGAAAALGWELHEDEDEAQDDVEED